MAFKKSKGKKKKNSKGKRDEWSHEGGQLHPVSSSIAGSEEKKKRWRETQDRDERLRRSRAKIEGSKLKRKFERKMSHKISFSDVLDPVDEPIDEASSKPVKVLRPSSSLSYLDRLNKFVSKSLKKRTLVEMEQGSRDNADEDAITSPDRGSNTAEILANYDSDPKDSDEASYDDCIDDNEDKSTADDQETNFYGIFFGETSQKMITQATQQSPKLIANIEDIGDLYGSINFDSKIVSKPVSSFLKLPSLHRLWDSMRDSPAGASADIAFSDLGATLMPYLRTYADAFLEGRNETNDDEFLDCFVAHMISHVMTARYVVIYLD
jgi:hypothetical protein